MKLSIITINYNNRAGLQRTIDSVICQTWHDYEWIIIDGGSSDGSKELIEQYQEHITYWCSEPDKGIYNAMNKGIDHAHGDYLIFMNSGDCINDKYVLENVWKEGINTDIRVGEVVSMEDGEKMGPYEPNENLFIHILTCSLNHQGAFIKRDLLKRYPYDETYKIVSDWKFWIETIILKGHSISFTNLIIAKQEIDGISKIEKKKNRQERDDVLHTLFSPILLNEIKTYIHLQEDPVVFNSLYLYKNYPFCYIILKKASFFMLKVAHLLKCINN